MLARRMSHLKRRKSFFKDKVILFGVIILLLVGNSFIPFYLKNSKKK